MKGLRVDKDIEMGEVVGIIGKELSKDWMKKLNNINKLESNTTTAQYLMSIFTSSSSTI